MLNVAHVVDVQLGAVAFAMFKTGRPAQRFFGLGGDRLDDFVAAEFEVRQQLGLLVQRFRLAFEFFVDAEECRVLLMNRLLLEVVDALREILVGVEQRMKRGLAERVLRDGRVPELIGAAFDAGVQRSQGGFELIGGEGFVGVEHTIALRGLTQIDRLERR